MNFATTILIVLLLAAGSIPAQAQAPLSPEEARALEYGKEIYKVKANCQFCHKWDASGDTGYGGIALSLRKTALTPEQFAEVVKCGRPGTGMPFHDQFAYTDKRCYGVTEAELGTQRPSPPPTTTLQKREIEAIVDYLLAKVISRGPVTREECEEMFGQGARSCGGYPNKQ